MSTNKHINVFVAVMMAFVTMFSTILLYFSADEEVVAAFLASSECRYEELFDQYHVMEIDIRIDENDFADILSNPTDE